MFYAHVYISFNSYMFKKSAHYTGRKTRSLQPAAAVCWTMTIGHLFEISLDITVIIYYNIINLGARLCFSHVAGGSCATKRRESCQAGNRAALSGLHRAPQSACPLHDQAKDWPRFINESVKLMYQALYRKWRPKTFTDVVGQQNITATLENEVESGSVSHAYLFTGSRGTGKTTCAKIMAKAVNCLNPSHGNPCNACENCVGIENGSILDVLELDAASNNGVDDIREMIDETNFTPVKAKYRVYIIDEVHMLTAAACNAFLKTLEEPPSHVIFILATTDPQKLPATIRSRCQRFDFKRIYPEDIVGRLRFVAEQEGLTLETDAAALIARIADGALRDALSLLDVCSVKSKDITSKIVIDVAGLADKEYLFALTDCVKTNNCSKALELIQELHNNSCEMELLCSELINHLRSLMIVKTVKSNKNAAALLVCTEADFERLLKQAGLFTLEEIVDSLLLLEGTAGNINKGVNKRVELEIAVIRLCSKQTDENNSSINKRLSALEAAAKTVAVPLPQKQPEREPSTAQTPSPLPVEKTPAYPAAQYSLRPKDDNTVYTPVTSEREEFPHSSEEISVEFDVSDEYPGPGENSDTGRDEPDEVFDSLEEEFAERPVPEEDMPESVEPCADGEVPFTCWPDVLKDLSKRDTPLWGFLISSKAFLDDETLFISTVNKASLEQILETSGHMEKLRNAVSEICGKEYRIVVCEKKTSAGSQNANLTGLLNRISELENKNF